MDGLSIDWRPSHRKKSKTETCPNQLEKFYFDTREKVVLYKIDSPSPTLHNWGGGCLSTCFLTFVSYSFLFLV